MIDSKKKSPDGEKKGKEKSRHPWRDNVEAITMAIVMAVMLKYFIVEAYKIPTGSMQPTLMGNDETGIKDRILVDKFSYHFRDPERFEITVFKYPLDLSKNFIKRLVGIGPEGLKIEYGDLWHRPEGEADWKVLRRPRTVQADVWKPLYPGQNGYPGWKAMGSNRSSWTVDGEEVVARGDGSLRYPPSGTIMDNYLDGYSLRVREKIRTGGKGNRNSVGDLRVSGEVSALEGCQRVVIELREGTRRYRFVLPGPAAPAEERPSISAAELNTGYSSPLGEGLDAILAEDWKLPAGSSVDFAVQNIDDLLSFEIDGDVVLELEIPHAVDQTSMVYLHVEGEGADVDDLMVFRDIYYLRDGVDRYQWEIPEGHYVMLGDNTQDSSDSREWKFMRIRHPRPNGPVYRGNFRGRENPLEVPGGPGGTVTWFRDEFGELHTWPSAQTEKILPSTIREQVRKEVSFVPRELITGRAVVVFWPLKPSMRLWRLKWIR